MLAADNSYIKKKKKKKKAKARKKERTHNNSTPLVHPVALRGWG